MEATFGTTDLADILADSPSCETASLWELLAYPDKALQADYEACWGDEIFTVQDQRDLLALLEASPITTTIFHSADTPPLYLQIPHFATAEFVRRLNMTWRPPSSLMRALDRHLDRSRRFTVRVYFRHARLAWHATQVRLAALFLAKMGSGAMEFESCLAFLLSLMSELSPHQEPYAFLIQKKSDFFQSLCKAEAFERKCQTSNMETLMLQGVRSAFGSAMQWRQQMRLIDRICETLFGRTEFFQQPLDHRVEVRAAHDKAEMEEIIRWLT